MRHGWTLVLLAACDGVFGLHHVNGAGGGGDAAMTCGYAQLDPGGDADGDAVLNGADTCPHVPSAAPADEDGDGTPDACDLCPQFMMAGADADCDAVGAACDPDEAVAHDLRFIGFADPTEIELYKATVVDGSAHAALTTADNFASARTRSTLDARGTFEATFVVGGNVDAFCEVSLALTDGTTSLLRFELESVSRMWSMAIVEGTTDGVPTVLGTRPADLTFRIRGEVSASSVRMEVTGDLVGTAEATIVPPSQPVQLALWFYRDDAASTTTVSVPYMLHVQPR